MRIPLPPARAFRLVVFAVAALLFALPFALLGCSNSPEQAPGNGAPEAGGPAWFEDVTATLGLDFVHDPGPLGTFFMPQSMGSGCAFLDFDGDGLLDIYLLHLGGPGG